MSKIATCSHAGPMAVTCTDCSLNPICLPIAVSKDELVQLDEIIKRGRPLKKGEHAFNAGEAFRSVYAVRSGSLKTYTVSEDGEEQVTGFYLAGEVLGMDGINTNKHTNSAKALESSAICEIPFERLESLSSKIPSLQRHFFQLMSKEIQSDQQLIMLLGKKPAEERIASFLLNIGTRHELRGLSNKYFRLNMSRNDIGNYLGLAVETVSRTFTRFQQLNIIKTDGKEVEVVDKEQLCALANVPSNQVLK
ncbi:MAG TPA: fumarate/nitrate reduction transcriptional regulator Fnr [Pseudomonadales bacterium]|nr:fumarate/nitrate reduction transcriptional regulator Fnr [Pseudomonadales bacterium]